MLCSSETVKCADAADDDDDGGDEPVGANGGKSRSWARALLKKRR